ncbi:gly-3 [Symbiodinium sp. KB8]|nr:gly-3 [Symbiodinium sp. KB8]
MAEIGGGWLSDFDTLPTFLDPEFGLPNEGSFTCYQTFIPGLLSGSGSEWRRMAYEVVNKASKDPELRKEGSRTKTYSDMFTLHDLLFRQKPAFLSLQLISDGAALTRELDSCAPFRTMSFGMHLSHETPGQCFSWASRKKSVQSFCSAWLMRFGDAAVLDGRF